MQVDSFLKMNVAPTIGVFVKLRYLVIRRPPSSCDRNSEKNIPAVFSETPRSRIFQTFAIFHDEHSHDLISIRLSVEFNEFVDFNYEFHFCLV